MSRIISIEGGQVGGGEKGGGCRWGVGEKGGGCRWGAEGRLKPKVG